MARLELELQAEGVRNINQRLVGRIGHRTLYAIKGVRKSSTYRELVDSMRVRSIGSPLRGEPALELDEVEREVAEESNVERESEEPEGPSVRPAPVSRSDDWANRLREAITRLGIPDGINIFAIEPGVVTPQTREMIDAEYTRWCPPKVRGQGCPYNRLRVPGQLPIQPPRARLEWSTPAHRLHFKRTKSTVLGKFCRVPGGWSLPQYLCRNKMSTGVVSSLHRRKTISVNL